MSVSTAAEPAIDPAGAAAPPPSALDVIRQMLGYEVALNRRVWEATAALSPEAFVAPVDYGFGSIRDHLVHLAMVDIGWLHGVRNAGERKARPGADEFPDRAAVAPLVERSLAAVADFSASLTDEELASHPIPGLPLATWQILLHVCNHGTDHRAQLLRLINEAGGETFEQDLLFHLMPR